MKLSREHPYKVLTPLNPTFIQQNWGLQGYTLFFLFLLKNIGCGYSLELPHWPISRTNFHGPKDVRAIEVWLYFKTLYAVVVISTLRINPHFRAQLFKLTIR